MYTYMSNTKQVSFNSNSNLACINYVLNQVGRMISSQCTYDSPTYRSLNS